MAISFAKITAIKETAISTALLPARDLTALFNPASVAIIGATDDTTKYGNWIGRRALNGPRPAYMVNPAREQVLGVKAHASVQSVGEPIDLAVIAVNVKHFESAVDDALTAGCRAIVGITAGLGEAGSDGQAIQDRVRSKILNAGAVMLGPNCLGVLDHTSNLNLTSDDFPVGRIALLSQSGNVALEMGIQATAHNLGFSRFASLGNQSDLDVADLIESCIVHDGTDAIAIYVEDFKDGRRFTRAAADATAAGKPVVLLAVGRHQGSARGAKSHTGALVSSTSVVRAACDAAGVDLVDTPRRLAQLLQGLTRRPKVAGKRVAVFADGGGQASIAADCVEDAGMSVPEFGKPLAQSLLRHLPPSAGVSNPIDVAGGGEADISCFSKVVADLCQSDDVDSVLMTGFFGGYRDLSENLAAGEIQAAHEIVRMTAETDTLIVVHTMKSETPAAQVLRDGQVPVFAAIEDAVWVAQRVSERALRRDLEVIEYPPPAKPITQTDYIAIKRVLEEIGLPFVRALEAKSEAEVVGLEYPLVVKALGDEHKSDRGGVALGIRDVEQLQQVMADMSERLAPESFSVEEMADLSDAVELIVGVNRDPKFGTIVLVGIGGTHTEVLRDAVCALGPVSATHAQHMFESLRGAALLRGVRGKPAVDVAAVAEIVAKLSTFAAAHPEISEIECNPVAALPQGAICLDARIILA